MAAVAGTLRPAPGPAYADSIHDIHDGQWEFVTPHTSQQYTSQQPYQPQFPQEQSHHAYELPARTPPRNFSNIHSSPSAFSRHSLHENSIESASLPNSNIPTNFDIPLAAQHHIEHNEEEHTSDEAADETLPTQDISEADFRDKWIHRDKLAEIESKELEEIGARLGYSLRAMSPKLPHDVFSAQQGYGDGGSFDRQDLHGNTDGNDENDLNVSNGAVSPTLPSHRRVLSAARAGKSRIPISTSSPLARTTPFYPSSPPVADSPLNNNRKSWRESLNSRTGSPVQPPSALPASRSPVPTTMSNTRLRNASTTTTSARVPSGTRKASTQSNTRAQTRARAASTTTKRQSWNHRPSVSDSRPHTPVNRPEGDAPWLATMFRPDPLLPPDEQMLPTHAKRLAMARGEHVLSNDELLEREIVEARRKEDGWQDPNAASNTNNTVANTESAGLANTQEVEEPTKPKMSARPSIKKLFSRNSMQSAKRHSGVNTPREEKSLEFEAGPDYSVHKAGKEPELVGQGPMERSSSYVRRLQGQRMGQGDVGGAVREQMSRQGSAYTGRSERIRSQELLEWPLPSPGRSSQVRLGQQGGQESPMVVQNGMLRDGNGNGNGTGTGTGDAMPVQGYPQNVGVQEKPRVTRVPDVPSAAGVGKESKDVKSSAKKNEKKEGGCGACCIVM